MDIVTLLATEPTGFWQSIIGWFEKGIGSYGWAIILFTICLKLILSPLDFYQKSSTRKMQAQQTLLKPELDRINEKYGNNKELVNQKTMELYKKNNINPASGCLPMLIYMVSTIVIFFTLFGAMNNVSQIKIQNEYENLQSVYVQQYVEFKGPYQAGETTITINLDGTEQTYNYSQLSAYGENYFETNKDAEGKLVVGDNTYITAEEFAVDFVDSTLRTLAQEKVLDSFTQNKEGWLWIKNVFRPDNNSSSFPNYSQFISSVGDLYKVKTNIDNNKEYYYKSIDETKGEGGYFYLVSSDTENASELNSTMLEEAKKQGEIDFNNITKSVQSSYSSWNGYFILVILAGLATLFGQLLANAGARVKTKKGEEEKIAQPTNKLMLVIMPIIMIWFTWNYSSAFALYILTNSLMGILINFLVNLIVNKVDAKKEKKQLVKVSLKDANQSKVTKQINVSESVHEDYRIQKKGKIIVEKSEKTSKKVKKENKNEQNQQNSANSEGENE